MTEIPIVYGFGRASIRREGWPAVLLGREWVDLDVWLENERHADRAAGRAIISDRAMLMRHGYDDASAGEMLALQDRLAAAAEAHRRMRIAAKMARNWSA